MQFIYWSILIGIGLAIIIIFMGKPAAMIACGLASIFCSIMNYDWFMINNKSAPIVAVFGRDGARVFYIIIGVVIIILAAFIV